MTGLRPLLHQRVSEDELPVGLLLIAFAAFACIVPAQADTFYHLRSGQEMWQSGSLLTRELFSWTEYGKPLPNHWWLGQLLFYGLFSLGGPILLTVCAGAMAFLAVLLTWRLTRGSHEIRIVLLLALAVTLPEWSVRPQVFSLLFCAIAIRLVLSDRLVLLPPLLVLWANMHAVVVLGIAIAGAAFVDAVVWDRTRVRRAFLVVLACGLAPMATPLGVHFWSWLIDTVGVSRALGLQEYRSAVGFDAAALSFWALAVALLAGMVRSGWTLLTADRVTRLLVLMAVVLAPAALTSTRNIPFFALAVVPALSRILPTRPPRRFRPASRVAWGMLAGATVAAAVVVVVRWSDGGARLGWRPFTAPALAAIEACPDPIYNGLYEGGQLIWFVPRHRVFVDGRVDVYPLAFLLRARHVDLQGDYRALFAEYGIRCAVIRPGSPLFLALGGDGAMRLAFSDERWAVFAR